LASELEVGFVIETGDAEGVVGTWEEEVGAGVLDTLSELRGTDADADAEVEAGALRRATLGLKTDFTLLASIELILTACSMCLCVSDQRMHISLWRWEKGPGGCCDLQGPASGASEGVRMVTCSSSAETTEGL